MRGKPFRHRDDGVVYRFVRAGRAVRVVTSGFLYVCAPPVGVPSSSVFRSTGAPSPYVAHGGGRRVRPIRILCCNLILCGKMFSKKSQTDVKKSAHKILDTKRHASTRFKHLKFLLGTYRQRYNTYTLYREKEIARDGGHRECSDASENNNEIP